MSTQNDRRADRAHMALSAYKGKESGPVDGETIVDLLVDLHHLLARDGKESPGDWLDDTLRLTHEHYEIECKEALEQEGYNTKPKGNF